MFPLREILRLKTWRRFYSVDLWLLDMISSGVCINAVCSSYLINLVYHLDKICNTYCFSLFFCTYVVVCLPWLITQIQCQPLFVYYCIHICK